MTTQNPKWKAHPEFPNYAASPDGKIKNIKTGQILKPYLNSIDSSGYLQVKITDRFGLQRPVYVHRFIFECFYGQIPLNHDIHHINHDRCDNSLNNLQCISHLDHIRLHQKDKKEAKIVNSGYRYNHPCCVDKSACNRYSNFHNPYFVNWR